jgi:hypothetical protein
MAMCIVDDESFNEELGKFNKVSSRDITYKDLVHGRNGKKEVPSVIRELASEMSIEGARPDVISEQLMISKSSISAYKHNATSTASYNRPDELLAQANKSVRNNIRTNALGRLSAAIETITEEKLLASKVRDAASVAKDMSVIVKNMEEENVGKSGNKVIIFRPRTREESDFEVIEVLE